jgi:hypothetical protein
MVEPSRLRLTTIREGVWESALMINWPPTTVIEDERSWRASRNSQAACAAPTIRGLTLRAFAAACEDGREAFDDNFRSVSLMHRTNRVPVDRPEPHGSIDFPKFASYRNLPACRWRKESHTRHTFTSGKIRVRNAGAIGASEIGLRHSDVRKRLLTIQNSLLSPDWRGGNGPVKKKQGGSCQGGGEPWLGDDSRP